MPTIHREGPFRFFFYSNEGQEPPHVHVQCGGSTAKLWLSPVRPADSGGLSPRDVKRATTIVEANEQAFLEAWREHFPAS